MIEAKTSVVKNQLSKFLARVRRGETVRILDRDTPVALLVPATTTTAGHDEAASDAVLLQQMEGKGLVRRATRPLPTNILDNDPSGKATGVLAALLEERSQR